MRTGAHKAHGETVEAKPPEAAHLTVVSIGKSVRSSDDSRADSALECGITHVRIGGERQGSRNASERALP